jgi:AbrB family looped-hinge helix DNA binding protein
MINTIYNRSIAMPIVKLMQHGQITIPKKIRDILSLQKGDLAEINLEGDKIVIVPRRLVKDKVWRELLEVMDRVHEKNKGVSEEQVTRDVMKAIAELREEEYALQNKT